MNKNSKFVLNSDINSNDKKINNPFKLRKFKLTIPIKQKKKWVLTNKLKLTLFFYKKIKRKMKYKYKKKNINYSKK